jgi:hypothetical protein
MRPRHGILCLLLTALLALWSGAQPAYVHGDDQPKKEEKPSNNKGKIEGTKWSSVESEVKGTKLPAGTLKLDFTKDGKLTFQVAAMTLKGTYTLGEGDKVVFTMEQEVSGKKKHEETIVIKDDRLTMTDSDGTTLMFEKVK